MVHPKLGRFATAVDQLRESGRGDRGLRYAFHVGRVTYLYALYHVCFRAGYYGERRNLALSRSRTCCGLNVKPGNHGAYARATSSAVSCRTRVR